MSGVIFGPDTWWKQYPLARPLDEEAGTWLVVMPLTFGRGRVCIANEDTPGIEFY